MRSAFLAYHADRLLIAQMVCRVVPPVVSRGRADNHRLLIVLRDAADKPVGVPQGALIWLVVSTFVDHVVEIPEDNANVVLI